MQSSALATTSFHLPRQTNVQHGSVRDIYTIDNTYMVMIATDRISAFDVVLPVTIPHKGQVLTQIARHFLEATADIVPNWLMSSPDPNVLIGHKCDTYKIEMVIRGYVVGHAWREYKAGARSLCGAPMPDGLQENDAFPEPIITPATHAAEGHDEDITPEEIIARELIPAEDYAQIEEYTRALFARGTALAAKQGLILVDTKYEFGKKDGQIYLIDEVHTPDSSRYFYAKGFAERQKKHEHQRQLSKEFVREWLIAHDFQGLDGQQMPAIPASFVQEISQRYIELYEQLTGQTFQTPPAEENIARRIEQATTAAIKELP